MKVPEVVLAGMRKTNDLFCSSVVRRRDMSALEQVYTPDAHILPPGADMVAGVSVSQCVCLQAITGVYVKDASLSTVSAETAGEDVVEIGRAALTLAGGQVVPVKYVVHWKRHEGNWKWHTDIWNMNQ